MKKLATLVLALATLCATQSLKAQWGNKKIVGSGNVTTQSVKTGNYDAIKVVGSMDVHLMKGSEGNISVTTDDNLHEYLVIEVEGNELVIKTEKNYNLHTRKGIHVTVPFQDLSEVKLVGSGDIDTKDPTSANEFEVTLTGSGDIELLLNVNSVESTITGSGDVTLKGTANNLEVNVTGSGDFSGFDLEANNTDVQVSGSGDAKVVAKQTIKARVNGSGDITYKGNPERSDTKSFGSGDINSFK